MCDESTLRAARPAFVRPIVVAIVLVVAGEAAIFLIWGLVHYPGQNLGIMAAWTAICAVSMGATIGALVDLFVTGHQEGAAAYAGAAIIWFVVLGLCTYLCYRIDLASGGRFGARDAPVLFLSAGLVPAFLSSFLYAWLVTCGKGRELLSRAGL